LRDNENYFAKQNSFSNEAKINNNKIKIIFLYYLLNKIFMLLDT